MVKLGKGKGLTMLIFEKLGLKSQKSYRELEDRVSRLEDDCQQNHSEIEGMFEALTDQWQPAEKEPLEDLASVRERA
jgi:hypothetical protein